MPGAKVFCLDAPGTGTELSRRSPKQVRLIVEDLRERWIKLKSESSDEDWNILGISLGGMLVASWVHDNPNDFRRAILINSSSSDTASIWQRLQPKTIPQLVRIASTHDTEERERRVLKMVSNIRHNEMPYPLAKVSVKAAVAQLLAASRFESPGPLLIPCLMLCSEKDQMVHPKACQKFAKSLGAEVRLHPSAGHELPLDAPEWAAQQVKSWLESVRV